MEIKRYERECWADICEGYMIEDPNGSYVLYDDIKYLLVKPDMAEVERLVDEINDHHEKLVKFIQSKDLGYAVVQADILKSLAKARR